MLDRVPEFSAEGVEMTSATFDMSQMTAHGKRLIFRRPIKVNVTQDLECYVANSPSFLVHGTGDTVGDAIKNYIEEFIRFFDWLVENESELALPLEKDLKKINSCLNPPSYTLKTAPSPILP